MRWPVDQPVVRPPVPSGYTVRTFRPGDEEGYLRMMRAAGMGADWNLENLKPKVLVRIVAGGLFLAVAEADGEIVGSAAAVDCPSPRHPHGGELGWVGVSPAHRGHGLAAVVSARALRHLIDNGYNDLFLSTDDHRLAALKTYLGLGWRPVVAGEDHESRWRDVCGKLSIDYSSLNVTVLQSGAPR